MNKKIKQLKQYLCKKTPLLFLLISNCAFAQSSDYATQFIYNVCTYASGNVARGLAVLAVVFLGYKCFKGTFDGHYLFYITVGLALIIGGTYYGKTVLLGGV